MTIFSHILVSICLLRQFKYSRLSIFNCIKKDCFCDLVLQTITHHPRFENVIPLPAKYLFLFLCKIEFSPAPSLKGKWWVLCVCGLHCRSEVITFWWLCFHFSAQLPLAHKLTDLWRIVKQWAIMFFVTWERIKLNLSMQNQYDRILILWDEVTLLYSNKSFYVFHVLYNEVARKEVKKSNWSVGKINFTQCRHVRAKPDFWKSQLVHKLASTQEALLHPNDVLALWLNRKKDLISWSWRPWPRWERVKIRRTCSKTAAYAWIFKKSAVRANIKADFALKEQK